MNLETISLETIGKHRSWLTSAAIVIAITVWLATGSGKEGDTAATIDAPTDSEVARTTVRIRNQVAEEVVRTISVNGRTTPARTVELNAETDGRVIATGVLRGERVDEGGTIVRLDERDRSARLAQALATVKQREVEFEGRERLKSESYVSDAQLQEAAALLEAARTELKRAELDIEYTTVRAPFDGALQERHVEVGDYVQAGDPIATIVDDRTLVVNAAISEYDAKFVSRGKSADALLATGETVSGVIRYVAPVADEATRTFTVELELENADGALPAGISAELLIPAETVLAHKISPSLLTLDDAGNVGVKIVNDQGVVEFFPADIALSTSEGIYIAGLPAAATIITVGQGFVTPGSRVDGVAEGDVDTAVAIQTGRQERQR
jgi:multidrug efflux system membrane fusion protein